jgi:hypothetical protein
VVKLAIVFDGMIDQKEFGDLKGETATFTPITTSTTILIKNINNI